MHTPLWGWALAVGMVVGLLLVDFRVQGAVHARGLRGAVGLSLAWIAAGVAFGVGLGAFRGSAMSAQYFAGYLLEKALSIDNVFVFALLFRAFAVPSELQHRVLFYGVFGALVLRGGFIAAGGALVQHVSWIFYVFGALLLLASYRMLRGEVRVVGERSPLIRLLRRVVPIADKYEGTAFLTRRGGRVAATPLVVALVAIEATDVVFAMDSIPAIFGVTKDLFVVFTSNAFAILGLRALYFVLAHAIDRFVFLRQGLALLLALIGVKMLLEEVVQIPIAVSLGAIVVVVAAAIAASSWVAHHGVPPRRFERER